MIKALTPSSRVLYTETTMGNKHAYLIMAHDNFEQLKLLLKALDNERTDIFIHIDKKSSFDDYSSLEDTVSKSHIEIFSEIAVYWSDFSITECEIIMLKKAKEHGTYSFYHLISNADFPTKPQKEILAFFDKNKNREFVAIKFPRNAWPFTSKPYTTEIKYYHILSKYYRTPNKALNLIAYTIEYAFVFLQFLLRIDRIHGQYVPAKGSQWWSITDDFASFILSKEEWIRKNYHKTRASDEVFVSVLAYNSEFRNRLYSWDFNNDCISNQRLLDWNRGFPYLYHIEDYGEIVSSDLPFVRKTDMRLDGGLVQKLYDRIMAASDTE